MTSPQPFHWQAQPGYGPPPPPARPSTAVLGIAAGGSIVLSLINIALAVFFFVSAYQGNNPSVRPSSAWC